MRIDILFINPPFNRIRPDYIVDASLARFEMDAINPGLLSIATLLRHHGYSVEILDFYRQKDIAVVERDTVDAIIHLRPKAVGISNLSAYDYLDTLHIASVIKQTDPSVFVLVGGQHASGLGGEVLADGPSIDGLVEGEGEFPILDIIAAVATGQGLSGIPNVWTRAEGDSVLPPSSYYAPFDLDSLPPLDFGIYPNAASYTPFIEESRGCHLTCDYCNNLSFYARRARNKSVERFNDDIKNTIAFFGSEPLYAIMTSNFSYHGSSEKLAALRNAGIAWSSEVSCDIPWHTKVNELASSGMFLLNVGFESASADTLRRMAKTLDASRYLDNARHIVSAAARHDSLRTRFNVMIYPGDTVADIEATRTFLASVTPELDAVVCCPTIAYPGSALYGKLDSLAADYCGASALYTPFGRATHHFPIHPSTTLSYEQASALCLGLEKEFSPERLLSLKHNYKMYEGRL